MKEERAPIPGLSYLRRYFCGYLVDQIYIDMTDSSLELLAPLPDGIETGCACRSTTCGLHVEKGLASWAGLRLYSFFGVQQKSSRSRKGVGFMGGIETDIPRHLDQRILRLRGGRLPGWD